MTRYKINLQDTSCSRQEPDVIWLDALEEYNHNRHENRSCCSLIRLGCCGAGPAGNRIADNSPASKESSHLANSGLSSGNGRAFLDCCCSRWAACHTACFPATGQDGCWLSPVYVWRAPRDRKSVVHGKSVDRS